jgi:glycosyltransferase involved in cell wall biosynthesis
MKSMGISTSDYTALANPIPVLRNTGNWQRQPERILYIGRLSGEKAVPYVLASFAVLRATTPEPYRLLVVGSGPEEPNLRNFVAALRITGDVQFVPEDFDIERYLYTSRLLIAGRANNTLAEAVATGTPAIGLDLGETRSLYGDYPNIQILGSGAEGYSSTLSTEETLSLAIRTAEMAHSTLRKTNPQSYTPTSDDSWGNRLNAELAVYASLISRNHPKRFPSCQDVYHTTRCYGIRARTTFRRLERSVRARLA